MCSTHRGSEATSSELGISRKKEEEMLSRENQCRAGTKKKKKSGEFWDNFGKRRDSIRLRRRKDKRKERFGC